MERTNTARSDWMRIEWYGWTCTNKDPSSNYAWQCLEYLHPWRNSSRCTLLIEIPWCQWYPRLSLGTFDNLILIWTLWLRRCSWTLRLTKPTAGGERERHLLHIQEGHNEQSSCWPNRLLLIGCTNFCANTPNHMPDAFDCSSGPCYTWCRSRFPFGCSSCTDSSSSRGDNLDLLDL